MKKEEILDALEDEREQFLEAIEGLSDETLQEPGVLGEWSIKDLMSHISAWEAELVKLLWQVQQGQKPSSIHFSMPNKDEINRQWYQDTRSRPLDRVYADFQAVRKQTTRRIEAISDKVLNDAQRYPWLNSHPLWSWVANDSFRHEDEHIAHIREWRARRGI